MQRVTVSAPFVLTALVSWIGWAAWAGHEVCERWFARPSAHREELEWLERSFASVPAHAKEVRQIHFQHAAERAATASELDRLSFRIAELVAAQKTWSPELQEAIRAWDEAAAKSHQQTWRYIYELSEHLDAGEARKYRAEMARQILRSVPQPAPPSEGNE